MNSSLVHVISSPLAIVVALVISWARGIDFREGLGLRPPAWRATMVWLAGFASLGDLVAAIQRLP